MKHLEENNETYISHLIFAYKIAIHLYLCSMFLMIHAVFPFWNQPESFSLDATCKKIKEWNKYAEDRKQRQGTN